MDPNSNSILDVILIDERDRFNVTLALESNIFNTF